MGRLRNLIIVCVVLALAVLAIAGFWVVRLSASQPEVRKGLLAQEDLETGTYALVFSYGIDMPDVPGNDSPAWLVDDQALIAQYRNEIDIGFSFLDFVPGERGVRKYLYVFRDGAKIGGQLVSTNEQIVLPQAIVNSARIVEQRSVSGNRAETEALLRQLLADGALIEETNSLQSRNVHGEFYFFAELPTIAVEDGAGFDSDAYARMLEQLLRAAGPEVDYALDVSLSWERPPGTVYFVDNDGWSRVMREDGAVASLDTLWLYDYRATIHVDPERYDDFAAIDLAEMVADHRTLELITGDYLSATGQAEVPDNIIVEGYKAGGWSDLIERQYGLRFWQ